MFNGLGAALGAFFSDPLKFLSDPANTTIEYQTKKLVEEGKTADEIEETLKGSLLKGAGPVKVIIDTVGNTFDFVLKNIPLIILLLGVLLFLNYIGRAKAALK